MDEMFVKIIEFPRLKCIINFDKLILIINFAKKQLIYLLKNS